MKAVGVLFGLLGLTNYFFFFNPKDEKKFWQAIYVITNAFLQGLQVRFGIKLDSLRSQPCSAVLDFHWL